jgi:hypothetical protein
MATPAKCPYCNQPLATDAAVKHVHQAEEKLRRRLIAEAKAEAKEKVQLAREDTEKKIRAQLEGERSKHERSLQRTVEGLQKQNSDLERKLEGLSAPERGDLNEVDVAKDLADAFQDDVIKREGKGGDIVHVVRHRTDRQLEDAGVILYECKDTRTWSNRFISQIKADGRKRQTPYLILVSRTFPAREKDACVRDDVVVADPAHVRHLARILRRMVVETHCAERAGQDRAGKTERLYEYLRGDEFREELASVIQIGSTLSEMLQKERKDHERGWSRRQRAYDDLVHNSVAIEESIKGIIESRQPRRRTKAPSRNGRPVSHSGVR